MSVVLCDLISIDDNYSIFEKRMRFRLWDSFCLAHPLKYSIADVEHSSQPYQLHKSELNQLVASPDFNRLPHLTVSRNS